MVIQRWQTVLLFVAAALMAVFSFVSLGQIQLPEQTLDFTTLGFNVEGESTGNAPSGYITHTWIFFLLSIMSALLSLIAIFLYNNMPFQKKICLVTIVFIISSAATGCIYGYNTFDGAHVNWSSMIIAPALAFISVCLAYRRISADQKLLRASDRIR